MRTNAAAVQKYTTKASMQHQSISFGLFWLMSASRAPSPLSPEQKDVGVPQFSWDAFRFPRRFYAFLKFFGAIKGT